MKAANPPLTDEQLQLAWRHLRRPPHWPELLEDALEHELYGPCIRGLARSLSRPSWVARHAAAQPAPASRPAGGPVRQPPSHWTFDAKRAAANDRDET
jgi:hypothetical protein